MCAEQHEGQYRDTVSDDFDSIAPLGLSSTLSGAAGALVLACSRPAHDPGPRRAVRSRCQSASGARTRSYNGECRTPSKTTLHPVCGLLHEWADRDQETVYTNIFRLC